MKFMIFFFWFWFDFGNARLVVCGVKNSNVTERILAYHKHASLLNETNGKYIRRARARACILLSGSQIGTAANRIGNYVNIICINFI